MESPVITTEARLIEVTQKELGRVLYISQPRVSQLVDEGVFAKGKGGGVLLVDAVRAYTMLKTQASNSTDELDYKQEKALHEKVKRELAELKLAKLEGRVYEASTVELVITEMLSNLRTQLLGLPAKLAPILDGRQKEEIYSTLMKEIESKLMDLSEYTPELFTQDLIEDEDVDEP